MYIAIVEDHLILSQSLQKIVEQAVAGSEVKLFANGALFLANDFKEWTPALVIADLVMPGVSGQEMLAKAMPLLGDSCKFIIMSSIADAYTVKTFMQNGVRGYVPKSNSIEELLEAIQTVMAGRQYISPSLKDDLLTFIFSDEPMVQTLSPRENEVLQQLCRGKTPKEIAYDMKLSIFTVKLYNKSILQKFKLNRTTDLIVYAINKGLYKPQ